MIASVNAGTFNWFEAKGPSFCHESYRLKSLRPMPANYHILKQTDILKSTIKAEVFEIMNF